MMEEDFYYSRENAIYYIKRIAKKALLFVLIIVSVASFLYITINAYYFSDKIKDNSINIVKSPTQEIKIKVKKDIKTVLNIDKVIYKNIVGNDKEIFENKSAKIVKNINPPKYQDKNLIKKEPSNIKIKKEQKIIDLSPKKTTQQIVKYGTRVQIAAMSSKDAAKKYWHYISKNNSNLVKNYDRYITEIDLGQRGVFYRLQIGNFKTQNKAEKFCQKFIMKNNKDESDCIILD